MIRPMTILRSTQQNSGVILKSSKEELAVIAETAEVINVPENVEIIKPIIEEEIVIETAEDTTETIATEKKKGRPKLS